MNTAQYRDEISGLGDLILGFQACVNAEEKQAAANRLHREWWRISLLEQPNRLPQADADKCQRLLNQASEIINMWVVDTMAGTTDRPAPPVPVKAMSDTMRFLDSMKRKEMPYDGKDYRRT